MASRNLGTLTMDLIARIGGFEAGLDNAERAAKKRAKAIEKVFNEAGDLAGKAFGTAVAGALAGAVVFDRLIKQIGDFQDIAEKTGGSAEGFASFAVAAATANTEISAIAAASVKLTKGLTGVDDESKAAGAAISALGLDLAAFKELSPEDQLEAVAKALDNFEDGAQKTAVAVALFGKAGADLLPFLKELESQGGRQVVLTAEQIRQADEYADKQARAAAELKQYAQSIAVQALPVVTAFTEALKESARSLLDVGDAGTALKNNHAVLDFAEDVAIVLARIIDYGHNAADVFVLLGKRIGAAAAIRSSIFEGNFSAAKTIYDEALADGDKLFKADFAGKVATQFSNARAALTKSAKDREFSKSIEAEAKRLEDAFGGGFAGAKPKLDFEGAQKKDKGGAAKQSEADRYLESLQKQLEKTQDLKVADQVLLDIQAGRLGKVTEAQKAQILLTAKQIDAAKEHEQVIKDMRAVSIAEGDAVSKANEAYQARLKTLMDATPSAILEKQRDDVKLLTDEYDAGRISEQQYLEAVSARLDLTSKKTEEVNEFAKQLGLSFSSSFEKAISGGKGLSDIFKSLAQDILKLGVREYLTKPFLELFNSASSGSGFGGFGLGGTAGHSGTNVLSGGGIGDIFSGISDFFGGFFADGGRLPVGKASVVGEDGPELVMPTTSATVIPNHALGVQKTGANFTYAPSIQIDSRADIAQVRQIVDRQLRGGFAQFTDQLNTAGVL